MVEMLVMNYDNIIFSWLSPFIRMCTRRWRKLSAFSVSSSKTWTTFLWLNYYVMIFTELYIIYFVFTFREGFCVLWNNCRVKITLLGVSYWSISFFYKNLVFFLSFSCLAILWHSLALLFLFCLLPYCILKIN